MPRALTSAFPSSKRAAPSSPSASRNCLDRGILPASASASPSVMTTESTPLTFDPSRLLPRWSGGLPGGGEGPATVPGSLEDRRNSPDAVRRWLKPEGPRRPPDGDPGGSGGRTSPG